MTEIEQQRLLYSSWHTSLSSFMTMLFAEVLTISHSTSCPCLCMSNVSLVIPCSKWNLQDCSRPSKQFWEPSPKCSRSPCQMEPWPSEMNHLGSKRIKGLRLLCSQCFNTALSTRERNKRIISTDICSADSKSIVARVTMHRIKGSNKCIPSVIHSFPRILLNVISKWAPLLHHQVRKVFDEVTNKDPTR